MYLTSSLSQQCPSHGGDHRSSVPDSFRVEVVRTAIPPNPIIVPVRHRVLVSWAGMAAAQTQLAANLLFTGKASLTWISGAILFFPLHSR